MILALVSSSKSGNSNETNAELPGIDASKGADTAASFTFSLEYSDPTTTAFLTDTSTSIRLKRSESVKMNKTIKTPKKLRHKLIRRHSDNSTDDQYEETNINEYDKPAKSSGSVSDPMRLSRSNNEVKKKKSTPKVSASSSPKKSSPGNESPLKSPRFISISPLTNSPPSPDEKRRMSRSSPSFPPRLDMMIRRKSVTEKQFAEEKRRSRKNSSESSETSLEQAVEEAVGERKRRASDSLVVSSESNETKIDLKKTRKRSHSSSSDTVSPKPSPPKKRSTSKRRFSFRKSSTSGSLDDQSDNERKEQESPRDRSDLDQFFEKWSDSKEFVYQFKTNKKACESTLQILLALFPVDALVEVLEAHALLLHEDESEDEFLVRVSSYKDDPPWTPDITIPILIKWAFIGTIQSSLIETYWNILIGPNDMLRALYLLVAEDERRLLMREPPLDPIDFASPNHFKWYAGEVKGLDCPLARIFFLMYGEYLPKKMRKAIRSSNGDIKAALFSNVKLKK